MSGSRQASPAPSTQPGSRKPSVLKLNSNTTHGHPSAMDIDATGGDASDGGRKKKKIKLTINGTSPSGSRAGSRVGSPAPGRAGSVANGSRPGSPAHTPGKPIPQYPPPRTSTNKRTAANASVPGRIQPEEVIKVLQQNDGISIKNLIAQFKLRLGSPGQLTQKEFIQQIKAVAKYGEDKLLHLK